MVEAAGIEPDSTQCQGEDETGQDRSEAGREASQAGYHQEDRKGELCKGRTDPDATPPTSGLPGNTPGALRMHTRSITEKNLSDDLVLVMRAWDHLPDAIKAGILAMVKSAGNEG